MWFGAYVARWCEASGEVVTKPLCKPLELKYKPDGEINAVKFTDAHRHLGGSKFFLYPLAN